jgi:hypothetical protein
MLCPLSLSEASLAVDVPGRTILDSILKSPEPDKLEEISNQFAMGFTGVGEK